MGISVWQILIVLLIVVLLFGTKKLRTLGGDLGEAVKGFKKGIQTDEEVADTAAKSIEHSETETKESVGAEFAQHDSSQKQASAS